ncbi:MAG TPA: ABC transporter substrate-binding protein [Burkholderiales bacterium]|nr:ABC transporter substrate-binding protein [Burkholderiales bacterium]
MLLHAGPIEFVRACYRCLLAAPAPRSSLPHVRLAIISEGLNTWPLYAALDQGLFSRAGVDVEVTLTRFSAKQLDALKSGTFDIGFQQCDHVVRAVEEGGDLFMFMALAHAPELTLVVAPGIRSFDDLRGKVIAVDGARSGYALLLRRLLSEKGLDNGDYVFGEIGGSRERHDALRDGNAAASLLNPPFDRDLLSTGFGSLGTTAQYFPTYTGSIAAARRSWATANAPALVSFIRGMNAAFAWLRDPAHKEQAIEIVRSRLDLDAEAAADAFDQFVQRPRPEIRKEGLRQVIDVVWDAESLALPKGDPERYMDLTYYERAIGAR